MIPADKSFDRAPSFQKPEMLSLFPDRHGRQGGLAMTVPRRNGQNFCRLVIIGRRPSANSPRTARKLRGEIIEVEAAIIPAAGPEPPALAVHDLSLGRSVNGTTGRNPHVMAGMHPVMCPCPLCRVGCGCLHSDHRGTCDDSR